MNELTVKEQSTLEECERQIERGMVSVGAALRTIRDGKLYRNQHKSFSSYLKARWSYTRDYAYKLIQSADTREKLYTMVDNSEMPTNERQLRELSKAPEEKQAEVWQKASEKAWAEDREPTAKDVKAVVAELEYEDVDDDDGDELIAETPRTPAELALDNAPIIQAIVDSINKSLRELGSISEAPGLELLIAREAEVRRALSTAKQNVATAKPVAICPRCNGAACPQCGNMGWINSIMAKELR